MHRHPAADRLCERTVRVPGIQFRVLCRHVCGVPCFNLFKGSRPRRPRPGMLTPPSTRLFFFVFPLAKPKKGGASAATMAPHRLFTSRPSRPTPTSAGTRMEESRRAPRRHHRLQARGSDRRALRRAPAVSPVKEPIPPASTTRLQERCADRPAETRPAARPPDPPLSRGQPRALYPTRAHLRRRRRAAAISVRWSMRLTGAGLAATTATSPRMT